MTGARTVASVLMTKEGYARLRDELDRLTTHARAEGAERLRVARANGGDPAENGDLMDAMDEQAQLEQRIRALEARLSCARIASPAADGAAGVGTRVRVRTRSAGVLEYVLVGEGEADPARGRISITSPVGQALHGRRGGDTVELQTPRRVRRLTLLSVEPADLHRSLAQAA
jgi:transcription elongation factor GreA